MKIEDIAVIGSEGHVGRQVCDLFKDKSPLCYDPLIVSDTKEGINKVCELSIICVPTPQNKDGSCDISIVEESVRWIETPYILIKSTVPPGTTDMLGEKYNKKVVFSPEFVGESKYKHSYWNTIAEQPFQTFGGKREHIKPILELFKEYCGPEPFYMQTDAKTAEMAKYMENVFFATKVTLMNEFYDICQQLGIDWDEAREAWLLDTRINRMHTQVFKNKRGFGGKCYPKDLSAMIKFSQKVGYEAELLKKVQECNENFKKS